MNAHGPVARESDATPVEFSTRHYADREGFSFWQDEICRRLSPSLTERVNPGRSFSASLRRVTIGRTGVCDISFSPMLNVRDARCLRQMPDDDLFVAVMKRGTGQLQQYGRSAAVAPGDVVLYDSGRPFEWRFGEESRMLVARMSRRRIATRLPQVDAVAARAIPAAQPAAAIIGTTLTELMRLDGCMSPHGAKRLGDTLIDLITSSLEACLTPPETGSALGGILARAKGYMSDNLDDPAVNLETLARHLGTSVSTLCRAFAAEGATPIRWLWARRLELAFRMLGERRVDQVSQVAMLCGFSDFSHFSRSFRKAYGMSPRSAMGPADAEHH